TVFEAIIITTKRKSSKEFKQKFAIYDEGFEYGSQLPDLFLKGSYCYIVFFFFLLCFISQTLLQHLVTTITDKFLPNYGLLMLWASLANAIPITFWTIAFMMSNPITYRTAMEQIDAAMKKQGIKSLLTLEDLQQMPYVKWCILEAMRLRAPGAITRKVVQPIKLQNYIIPSGDLLMMSPYWAHRNPEYFPNPEEFRPERWEQADLVKNAFLEGFVAFGGGKYQCPGRWYAIMELHMFVALILYKYEFTLLDSLPKPVSFMPFYQCHLQHEQYLVWSFHPI
uniref:24-hydroxycholesterol 7-alpha-hydroxylase n=1 Tax=Denticeps clupeoides TaxID=299321 RepID=A0AAY4C069_9TELE